MRTIQHLSDPTEMIPAEEGRLVPAAELARWQEGLHKRVRAALESYTRARCDEHVHGVPGADLLTELLTGSGAGGKCVRSTFTYLGWLSGTGEHGDHTAAQKRADSDAALRAAASV